MTVTALYPRRLERRLERIRRAVIGDGAVVDGPFGPRRLVYADWTASGRSLDFVEDVIRDAVLPLYANTHTEASATGRQTTRLREDARRIVHRAVGGGDDDVVVFCGSGATGAIDRLMRILELDRGPRPVVFVGPFEHHSNELPWRESAADVVAIREDADGRLDLEHLRAELERHAGRALKIGSFSAASNVTGVVTDADAVSILLHRHGALAFWDCAAAAPHLPIDMNPAPAVEDGELAYKDAVFISPHKLPGGPGTPGVLVAKRHLFANEVPAVPGGGTVEYVTDRSQAYLADPAHREEGGTPGDRRVDPCGARLRAAGGGRRGDDRRARGGHRPEGARLLDGRSAPRSWQATRSSSAWRSSRWASPPAARPPRRHAPPGLRRRAPGRPLRDPGAQRLLLRRRPTSTAWPGSTLRRRPRSSGRRCAAAAASGPGFVRLAFAYFTGETESPLSRRRRPLRRRARLEAPAPLPLRPRYRPLAPSRPAAVPGRQPRADPPRRRRRARDGSGGGAPGPARGGSAHRRPPRGAAAGRRPHAAPALGRVRAAALVPAARRGSRGAEGRPR